MSGSRLHQPPANVVSQSRPKNALDSTPVLVDNLVSQTLEERNLAIAERDAQIRIRWINGDSTKKLCDAFGLSASHIYKICKGLERQVDPKAQRNAEIRERWANGESDVALSHEYNLSLGYLIRLCKGVERKPSVESQQES